MPPNTSNQLKLAHLCSYCSEIPFEAMALPTTNDLRTLLQREKPIDSEFFQINEENVLLRVSLGNFTRILLNEAGCDLCALLGPILLQQEGTPSFGQTNGLSANGEELGCEARVSYCTRLLMPFQQSHQYVLNRLSVFCRVSERFSYGSHDCLQVWTNNGHGFDGADGLLVNDLANSDIQLFGGRLRPAQLNTNWVAKWMSICDREHGARCLPNQLPVRTSLSTLRFVDVVRDCIAVFHNTAPESVRYTALSYVWGKSRQSFDIRTTNIDELTNPGSLWTAPVSRTIADAILLTKQLGINYLWVDAMSILQDSDEDKVLQIKSMKRIYQSSYLTIICAAGSHADVGLPGLRPNTRSGEQPLLRVPLRKGSAHPEIKRDSMVIMPTLDPTRLPLRHPLSSTSWMSRAWTMQERLLSRRALTFTKEQVWWSCMERNFCEESYYEHEFKCERFGIGANDMTLPLSSQARSTVNNNLVLWDSLRSFVASYSARNMSHHGDVYNAFLGVQLALTDITGEKFIYGMPCSRFETALSWKNSWAIERRVTRSSLPMTELNIHIHFPSWSWMGWKGEAWMSVDDDIQVSGFAPAMRCFVHRRSPDLYFPLVNAAEDEEFLDLGIGDEIDLSIITASLPELNHDRLLSIPSETLLFFHTHTAKFYVLYPHEPAQPGYEGITANAKPQVFLNLESVPQAKPVVGERLPGAIGTLETTLDCHKSGYYTFAVIGKVSDPDAQFVSEDAVVLQLGNWSDDEHAHLGIVRRLNIGTINEKSFWQQVSLQGKSQWDDGSLIVLG